MQGAVYSIKINITYSFKSQEKQCILEEESCGFHTFKTSAVGKMWLLPSLKKKIKAKQKPHSICLNLYSVFWNPANTAEQKHSNTSSKLKAT